MFWQINITPLTDIFLVLLIIFMVTTSVTIEAASHVDLPLAENTSPENKGVIVTYTTQHELFVNSKDVTERDLETALTDALTRVDSKVVIFQGDEKVLLGDMIRVLQIAKLAGAPFLKVEATKFTEVGYVGRDVESMVRDLVELAVDIVRAERIEEVRAKAAQNAEDRLLDLLLPPARPIAPDEDAGAAREQQHQTRERFRDQLRAGRGPHAASPRRSRRSEAA